MEAISLVLIIGAMIGLALRVIWWVVTRSYHPVSEARAQAKVSSASKKGDKQGEVGAIMNLGNVQLARGKPMEALQTFMKGVQMSKGLEPPQIELVCLIRLGEHYDYIGETQKALKTFYKAKIVSENIGEKNAQATITSRAAKIYRKKGEDNVALKLYRQALKLTQLVDNKNLEQLAKNKHVEAQILNELAELDILHKDPQAAITKLERAKRINEINNNEKGVAYNLVNLASAYVDVGRVEEAQKNIDEASKMYNIDIASMTDIAIRCAEIYQKIGNSSKVSDFYSRALTIPVGQDTVAENVEGIACYHYAMYNQQWNYYSAKKNFESALQISRKYGDADLEAKSLVALGHSYIKAKKIDKANSCFSQALSILEKMESPEADKVRTLLS